MPSLCTSANVTHAMKRESTVVPFAHFCPSVPFSFPLSSFVTSRALVPLASQCIMTYLVSRCLLSYFSSLSSQSVLALDDPKGSGLVVWKVIQRRGLLFRSGCDRLAHGWEKQRRVGRRVQRLVLVRLRVVTFPRESQEQTAGRASRAALADEGCA